MKFLVKTRSQPLDGVTSERMWVQAQMTGNSTKHDPSVGSGLQPLRTCGWSFGLYPRERRALLKTFSGHKGTWDHSLKVMLSQQGTWDHPVQVMLSYQGYLDHPLQVMLSQQGTWDHPL